jgi:hypothetical protein
MQDLITLNPAVFHFLKNIFPDFPPLQNQYLTKASVGMLLMCVKSRDSSRDV